MHPGNLLPGNPQHLRLGQPEKGWRRDPEHSEHQVDLPAVVRLVFDHGAQPLPGADRGAGGGDRPAGPLFRRQGAEEGH